MDKIYTEMQRILLVVLASIALVACNTTSNDVIITAAPTYCLTSSSYGCGYSHQTYIAPSCSCPHPYSSSHSSFNSCCYRQGTYPVYNQDSAAMVSTGSYYYQYHK